MQFLDSDPLFPQETAPFGIVFLFYTIWKLKSNFTLTDMDIQGILMAVFACDSN